MTGRFRAHLALAFLRAQPVRFSAIVVALTTMAVVTAALTLQTFQQSPSQLAIAETGRAEYSLRLDSIPTSDQDADSPVADALHALEDSGATDVSRGYFIFDVPIDGDVDTRTSLFENDWQTDPFPGRLTLAEGRWPAVAGEVAITTSLAEHLGAETVLSMAHGAISLPIVGIVEDDFFRTAAFGFLAPGTWESLQVPASRYAVSAVTDLFWSGPITPDEAGVAIDPILTQFEPGMTPEGWSSRVVDRLAAEDQTSTTYSESFLLMLIAPFAAGFVGGSVAVRFIVRVRGTLRTIGVFHTATAGAIAIAGSTLVATTAGSLLGIAISHALRPALDTISHTSLGPLHSIGAIAMLTAGSAMSGVALSMAQLRLGSGRRHRGRNAVKARRQLPSLKQFLPSFVVIFVIAGLACAQTADTNIQIASAYLIGFAVVLLAPYALDLIAKIDARSLPATLGLRRLRAQGTQTAWAVVSIGGILMLAFTLATLYSSNITSANNRIESDVPPTQAHFSPAEDFPDPDTLRSQIEAYSGVTDPVHFSRARVSTNLEDGAVLVFASTEEMERVLETSLPPSSRIALEEGAIGRTKDTPAPEITLRSDDGTSHELSVIQLDDVNESFHQYGGVLLESVSDRLSLERVRSTWAYTHISDAQRNLFDDSPQVMGFDRSWTETYSPPMQRGEPPEFIALGAFIGVIAGAIMAAFSASAARALRPNLAAVRAIGAPRAWSTVVLLTQVGVVLTVTLGTAVIAALAATLASIQLWMQGTDLFVPWGSLAALASTLVVCTALALMRALRRLDVQERLSVR